MFRKKIKLEPNANPQSKKQRKQLKARLSALFDPESVKRLFFYADLFTIHKVKKKKIHILSFNNPLLISINKKEYIPSLYLICMFPDFIQTTINVQ